MTNHCQYTGMHRKRGLQNAFRIRAVGSLMVILWVAALTVCSAECLLDVGHCSSEDGGKSCGGGTADPKAPTPDNDKNNGSCDSLESSRPSFTTVSPVPATGLAIYEARLQTAARPGSLHPHSASLRQRHRRDMLWTPEVYLGPAFRSLAPPSLHA